MLRAVMATTAVYPVNSQPQNMTEPSSADQSVTTLTQVGEAMRECSATYFTVKSSVRSATSISAIAVVIAMNTATAANRAEVCKRASCRTAPSTPVTMA